MLRKALSKIKGPFNQLFANLCGNDGEIWFKELTKFLRKEPCWAKETVSAKISPAKVRPNVLGEIENITNIPSSAKSFVVKENFTVNTEDDAEVKISYVDLEEDLLEMTESPLAATTIGYRRLLKDSADKGILRVLGGKKKSATTLREIHYLMKSGALDKSKVYIFYVFNRKRNLRAVGVDWGGRGWRVDAFSVEGPFGWVAGSVVASRNS